jgi:chemotaxis-related protein WspD
MSDEAIIPIVDSLATTGPADSLACWSRIGVSGDHSCPELVAAIHCRNCPVFADAARAFLDRPAPEGYLGDWTRLLDADGREGADAGHDREGTGVVLFRLGAEWLALPARFVVEVTSVRPVHRIPHRTNAVVAGLANLHGHLHLCASLHDLLDVARTGPGSTGSDPSARMIVIRQGSESWVFTADEVLGVPRITPDRLRNVPSTLANTSVSFSQAVFEWQGRSVGLLDETRVFHALRNLGG